MVAKVTLDRQPDLGEFIGLEIRVKTLDVVLTGQVGVIFPYTIRIQFLGDHTEGADPVIIEVDTQGSPRPGLGQFVDITLDGAKILVVDGLGPPIGRIWILIVVRTPFPLISP